MLNKNELENAAKITGFRLEMLRRKHHLTQVEFADKIEWAPRFISEWESGKKLISIKALIAISREFPISWDHFNPDKPATIDI